MNAVTANTIFSDYLSSFGNILLVNIPKILLVLSALVGLSLILLYFFDSVGGGTTNGLGRSFGARIDHLTYRPFKGAHRGYWYRLNKKL